MSYGVFQYGKGNYTNEQANYNIKPEQFKQKIYIDPSSERILVEQLKIPKKSLAQLNELIGQFLHEIQETSMVPIQDVQKIVLPSTNYRSPMFGDLIYNILNEHKPDTAGYCTTLSPEKLIKTVRIQVGGLLQAVILEDILNHADQQRIKDAMPSLKTEKEPETPPGTVSLDKIDFLNSEAKRLIKAVGGIEPEEVNHLIMIFAKAVMQRSKLSIASTEADLGRHINTGETDTNVNNFPKYENNTIIIGEKSERYSTLDPNNLQNLFIQQLRGLLGGIILSRERENAPSPLHPLLIKSN